MAGGDPEWEIVQLMPNLVLPKGGEAASDGWPQPWPGGLTLGTSVAAIVPPDDARVVGICERSHAARALVQGCRDSADRSVRASVLVTRKDAKLGMDALVDFRNAVAFTFLLIARAHVTTSGNGSTVAWSDTWDFHPAFVTDRDRLIVDTPALFAWYAEEVPFRAMPSPYVGANCERLFPDPYLSWALPEVWLSAHQRSDRQDGDAVATRLFRSLQLAYQASTVPVRHRASLHEFGVQIALWVSAIEILAWSLHNDANLGAVSELLALVPLPSKAERLVSPDSGSDINAQGKSPIRRAYETMYRVRNEFIHGNPVTSNNLRRKTGNGILNVFQMAAPVYRTALVGYLNSVKPLEWHMEGCEEVFGSEVFARASYANALDVALGDGVPDCRREDS